MGSQTDIWRHRWISNHFDGRPITPREDQVPVRVSDLITASGQWNEALIRDVFLPIDANAIIRQPLGRGQSDFWAWEKERFGTYTVKTAYKLLHAAKINEREALLPSSSDDWQWKAVWKMPVPPKVRVFWWRVLKEFLPARDTEQKAH